MVKGIFDAGIQFRESDKVEYGFAGSNEFVQGVKLFVVWQQGLFDLGQVGLVVFGVKHGGSGDKVVGKKKYGPACPVALHLIEAASPLQTCTGVQDRI